MDIIPIATGIYITWVDHRTNDLFSFIKERVEGSK